MFSLTNFCDNARFSTLSLEPSQCAIKTFVVFHTNFSHYIPSLCPLAGVYTYV